MIDSIGSTSSIGNDGRSELNSNSPRSVISLRDWSSTDAVYCLKMSYRFARVECCSLYTVSGLNRCGSPSRRHWYSPPSSSRRCARSSGRVGFAMRWRAATSAAISDSPMPPSCDTVPVKYCVDHIFAEADRLEDLGAGVRRDRRHAHLRHHLEDALAARLDVVAHRLDRVHVAEAVHVLADEVLDGFEGEVRVDRTGAEPDQERHVVHFAGVTGFDDQPGHRALLGAHEVMMDRRGEEE